MENTSIENQAGPSMVARLFAASAHWGRRSMGRKVDRSWIAKTISGVGLIDLDRSVKELGLMAAALRRCGGQIAVVAPSAKAAAAAEASGLAGRFQGSRIWKGRWLPGALTNWQCGAWGDWRPEAMLAVGPGCQDALREAKRLGIPSYWISDTDGSERLCSKLCSLNASSEQALGLAIRALLG